MIDPKKIKSKDLRNADDFRSIVEEFREAALKEAEQSQQWYGTGVGAFHSHIEDVVKYDTWLKLDDAERARKAAEAKRNSGPRA